MTKEVWKAIAHLHPTAKINIDYNLEAVGDNDPVITFWRLAQAEPTQAEIDAAILAFDITQAQETTRKETLRTLAQGLIGRSVTDAFTAVELKLLLFKLIHDAGGLKQGKIKDFNEW